MQSETNLNRAWVLTLAALGSLELVNLLLWLVLIYGSRLLVNNGIVTGADHSLMMIVGAYPILLLSPLLTKWYFRGCSLLPLYALNLAQMGVVTWGVIR